jgi:F-type H+-transporting ATPase subunit epsilon
MRERARLRLVVRTPRGDLVDAPVDAVRLPTETGQVGLRPGAEALRLAVEPGLVLVRSEGGPRLVATAGGLLEVEPARLTLYTPFAAVGDTAAALQDALDAALADPEGELAARLRLAGLEPSAAGAPGRRSVEQRILRELGRPGADLGGDGGR